MPASVTNAEWVGLSFVVLGIVLMASMYVRRHVPGLAASHIPASVIAGFLLLALGPQVLGAVTGRDGVVPQDVVDVLATLPALLINVVFAGIMVGKALPNVRSIWTQSAPHVILGSVFSFGQFALSGIAVALLLRPLFGLPDAAGSIIELSFAGGHGTIAGMGGILDAAGAPEVVDLGLGLATISMITGVVGGSVLVNYAIRSPKIPVARTRPVDAHAPTELRDIAPNAGDSDPGDVGLNSTSRSFGAIAVAIAIGIVILSGLRTSARAFGSDLFDNFPLFPFTVIGGFVVQAALTRTRQESLIERRTVNDITGLSLDLLIAAAIGTMSLAALAHNIPSLVILTTLAFGWSAIGMLWLGPRIHGANWFEHGVADYGQSQGNVATGFVLADMADPERATTAATSYGYKQLIYEPFLGGGVLTALSVPLILEIGPAWFGAISLGATVALILWGVRRSRAPATAG